MIEQLQSDFFILDIYLLPDSRFAYQKHSSYQKN